MENLLGKMPRFLNGTHLKLLALFFMTVDHIGYFFYPNITLFRILGRLAFPIFSYMVAEGCFYTRHRWRYFSVMFGFGVGMQLVCFFIVGSLSLNIFFTLSLGILLVYALDYAKNQKNTLFFLVPSATLLLLYSLHKILLYLLRDTDYSIDYTFAGVLLPALISLGRRPLSKLLFTGIGLILITLTLGWNLQFYSLFALIPLFFYNGTAGKHRMKWLFYLYYPAHFILLYGIRYLIA